jgi:hypothetical protein
MIDIFFTSKGRTNLFIRSMKSFFECTDQSKVRTTLVLDGTDDENESTLDALWNNRGNVPKFDCKIVHGENVGLGPSINEALAHIDATNRYYEDPRAPVPELVSQLMCMLQDDILYTAGWLEELTKWFLLLEKTEKIGFASGIECIEHKEKKRLGKVVLKDWVRATCMLARREYWLSMWPIPRFDPETGRVRAKPDHGMGSGVDWHFIRNHPNSVCKTGRTCLTIPGLLVHCGFRESTWLERELPESDEDKRKVTENL